jgi:hypothetical protein
VGQNAGISYQILIIDMSDPTAPTTVSTIDLANGIVDIEVRGTYAFVACGHLRVYDISSPASPLLVGLYYPPAPEHLVHVAVSEDYAYAAVGVPAPSMRVLDIRNLSSITDLGVAQQPEAIRDLVSVGDYVFAAEGYNGLQVIDVSDPSNPFIAQSFNTPGLTEGVALVDSQILVADRWGLISAKADRFTSAVYGDSATRPKRFYLGQNYPNPFNSQTRIAFFLRSPAETELEVFNIMGQKIRTLVHQTLAEGQHAVPWDGLDDHGRSAPSGVYLYRLRVGQEEITRKMLLLK